MLVHLKIPDQKCWTQLNPPPLPPAVGVPRCCRNELRSLEAELILSWRFGTDAHRNRCGESLYGAPVIYIYIYICIQCIYICVCNIPNCI